MPEEIIETEEIKEEVQETPEETPKETPEVEEIKEVDEEEEKKTFIQKTLEKLGIGGEKVEPEEEKEGELISESFI